MLKRFAVYFALIFLFAFTQIGVVTHEISHLGDFTKHSQQDKKAPAEQCGKCISYSQVANGLQSQAFALAGFEASFQKTSSYYFNAQSSFQTAYAARAPPQINSI
jgi:amino acid transporter